MSYRLERAEGGSLPTIVSRYGISILAIDERVVGGKRVTTPVFATTEIAERVLDLLNTDQATTAEAQVQRVKDLIAWWDLRKEYGPVVRELRNALEYGS